MLKGAHQFAAIHAGGIMKTHPEIPNENLGIGYAEILHSIDVNNKFVPNPQKPKIAINKTSEDTLFMGGGKQIKEEEFPKYNYLGEDVAGGY